MVHIYDSETTYIDDGTNYISENGPEVFGGNPWDY